MLTSPEILVPIDFSPCSVNALKVAIGMASPEGDLTLLHVVDEEFIQARSRLEWVRPMISEHVSGASGEQLQQCARRNGHRAGRLSRR
jgi:nucleotide-binding universal stress UspA family protein